MPKIPRPYVQLPPAPKVYDQREEQEFRRLVEIALRDPIEDLVRPQDSGITLAVGNCVASDNGSAPPPYNRLVVNFTATNAPVGTVYDVAYNNGVAGGVDSSLANSASPVTFNSVTFAGTPGRGAVTVTAKKDGLVLAVAVKNKVYVT